MSSDQIVREQLVNMLIVRQAHMDLEDAVKDFPPQYYNSQAPNVTYTFWHLLEHIRITQLDILDYIRNPDYQEQKWPDDYWPARDAKTDADGWNATLQAFYEDRQALVEIVKNPDNDMYAQIPHGMEGHNILREINVVANHNAYHTGELGILRQVMNIW